MFPNTSALRVVQYTPKVSASITYKLPAKPSWSKYEKEPVNPMATSKRATEDTEQEKRCAAVGGLMPQNNPLFDVKTTGDEITQREDAELLARHRARFKRKVREDRPQELTPGSNSDELIELNEKLDNDSGSACIYGSLDGRSQFPGCTTGREDFDSDSDDEFPGLNRLLQQFKRKSPEEDSDGKSSVEDSANDVPNNHKFDSQESKAGNSSDEVIEIDDDSKLDLSKDLSTTEVAGAQSNEQPDCDLLHVETRPAPDRPINESCNSIDTTDSHSSSSHVKRVRFASPCNIHSPGLSISPHLGGGAGNRSITDPESSDSDELPDGISSRKRQKLTPQVVQTASHDRDERSSSVISDADNVVGLESLSDDNLTSNDGGGIVTIPDSAVGASRTCPQFVDINQEWEYSRVLGEEVVGGVAYYEVEWCPSLIPKSSVRNIEVLMEYEARKARARACGTKGKRRGRQPVLKQDNRAVTGTGALADQQQKRPRGRPRKVS